MPTEPASPTIPKPSATPTIPSPSGKPPAKPVPAEKPPAPKPGAELSTFVPHSEDGKPKFDAVQVKNVSRRMLTLVLAGKHLAADVAKKGHPHRHAPVKLVAFRETKDGKLSLFSRTKYMPTALRIPAGATVDVHKDALGCPDMIKAIKRGQLRQIESKFDAKADTKTEAAE